MACIRLSGSGQTQSAAVAIRPKHKRGLPHPNNFRPTSVQFKGRINSDKARKRHRTRHLEFYTPRLLTENSKSNNSFLWRQLTASGPSPNTYFLSPGCPQHYFRPSSTPRHTSRSQPMGTNRRPVSGSAPIRRTPRASAVTVRQPEVTDCNLTAPSATLGALSNCRELLSHPLNSFSACYLVVRRLDQLCRK